MREEKDSSPRHFFVCACDMQKEMTAKELLAHVKEVHGVNLEGKKGKKELISHVNRRPRHISCYKLECEGLTFYEYYR